MLARAGQRAASLAAAAEARRYFEQAAELDGRSVGASRAARTARARWRGEPAIRTRRADCSRSRSTFASSGAIRMRPPVVSARLGDLDAFTGRRDEALAGMERAFAVVSGDEPDEDLALLAARLARAYWFSGDLERAAERAEFALDIAETYAFREVLTIALRAKAAVVFSRGHTQEANALLRHALQIAIDDDLADHAGTCYFLLSDGCFRNDQYGEALAYLDEALVLARKVGDRPYEWASLSERTYALYMLGQLGRGADCSATNSRREQLAGRRRDAELASDGRRDPCPAWGARRGTSDLLDVREAGGLHGRAGPDGLPRCASLPTPGRRSVAGSVGGRQRRPSTQAAHSASRSRR